jgi:hypothetical protein
MPASAGSIFFKHTRHRKVLQGSFNFFRNFSLQCIEIPIPLEKFPEICEFFELVHLVPGPQARKIRPPLGGKMDSVKRGCLISSPE